MGEEYFTPFRQFQPDPEHPGWLIRRSAVTNSFFDIFGLIRMKVEGERETRIRFYPETRHRNILDSVHGGFIMAVADQVLFLAPAAQGIEGAIGGSTVDASVQFLSPLKVDEPMDVLVEVLRETGRMIFMRGLFEQTGTVCASFSGTIRKASQRT